MRHPFVLAGASRRQFLSASLASAGALSMGSLMATNVFAKDIPLAPPDKQPEDLELPELVKKKVGYAVVGLGQLAVEEVLPAFAECKYSKVTALVSGHPDKAKQLAKVYGVDEKSIYNYENYDKLADNPDVDVIYIILPNSMHAEYTIRGLKAGKHVLCEKPMAPTPKDCREMIAASEEAKKKLMIAYRLHYEPLNLEAMKLCREGAVGEIKTITASNCQVTKAPNIRLSKKLQGGPLVDIGIYCLNATRYLTDEEPVEVFGMAHRPKDDPTFAEVPESVLFTLKFPSGIVANCDCSFGAAESRFYRVNGSEGTLTMDPAFSYRGLRLFTQKGAEKSEHLLREKNHFAEEMDHLSHCVLHDEKVRTPGEEGLADMRIIAAIEESIETGKTVKIDW